MSNEQRRVVLLTGATSGLCAGVAQRLAEHNYRVVIATREDGGDAAAVLARVHPFDPGAMALPIDLHDAEEMHAALTAIEDLHGPVYAVVHGRGPMHIKRFEHAELEDAHAMLAENLTNGIALAHAVLPGMRARRCGRIVYFGMTGSTVTRPARGLALYGAAKAGLVAFARTLALEEAHAGVTVNVVEPGDIREKERLRAEAWEIPAMNPTGHAGSWEDVADAVLFLLSYQAGFVNGTTLAVGGGLINASE